MIYLFKRRKHLEVTLPLICRVLIKALHFKGLYFLGICGEETTLEGLNKQIEEPNFNPQEGTESEIEIYENDIDMFLNLFCEENGINNIKEESQSVWNAALIYIKRHVFNDKKNLKINYKLYGYHNNNYNNNYKNINQSTCNAYDIDKIIYICDYYIYICNLYNKGVTISGFSKLTGISEETIYQWGRDDNKLSTSGLKIYQKLAQEYENSLESKLWSNKNPVAHMAIANKRFGWNISDSGKEYRPNRALSASELPKLGSQNDKIEVHNSENID